MLQKSRASASEGFSTAIAFLIILWDARSVLQRRVAFAWRLQRFLDHALVQWIPVSIRSRRKQHTQKIA